MVAKPSAENILKFYSLDELLNLIREKAALEAEGRLAEAKKHLSDALNLIGGGWKEKTTAPRETEEPPAVERKPRGPRKKAPLGQLIQQVLGPQPMKIDEILTSLQSLGYKSKSKDPRRILYLELTKQVANKTIKKLGRGMYASK
ncbi:MAG TPA: hypothetical protein PK878_17080 [bacterium]|nr:hypothetical protein [Candidatus Omnitrophota bacterium]HOJ61999.1 hypothetical protein [bacterium]HOL96257.1 hypothetical protein [bacterium]HPP00554.1 hypothetical protein [bacterium]HXK94524.1 hypothetical protein [bacterium]